MNLFDLAVPAIFTVALAAFCGLFYYMRFVEPKDFRLEREQIIIGSSNGEEPNDSESLLKILHISDLHLDYPDKDKIEFLEGLYDEEFDLVILTGDIFENLSGLAYVRNILRVQPKLGAYAVLGNHDYYNYNWVNKTVGKIFRSFRTPKKRRNVEPIIDGLKEAGFQVLRNESVSLADGQLQIIGIDYPGIKPHNFAQLLSEAPSEAMRIVLFHLPAGLEEIASHKVHLAFGGHTHGGQIRLPGFGALITDSELKREHASGLSKIGDTYFHISRGLGADPKSNIRLWCPPAATVLEIRA